MHRERFLFVHGIDAAQWAARFEIEPSTHPCYLCGEPLTTSVPFAIESLRGLAAPACACGNQNTPYCVVRDPRFGDLFTGTAVRSSSPRGLKQTSGRVLRLQQRSGSADA